MEDGPSRHIAFGVRLRSALAVPELARTADSDAVDVDLVAASVEDVHAAFSGATDPPQRTAPRSAGALTFTTERGRAGDLLVALGDGAAFLLDGAARLLRCAPTSGAADPAWRRFLLDTVLGTVAMERGIEMLHGGCFARGGGAIAIVAGEGGGKSTLLATMLARGHDFVTDDLVALERVDGRIVAHPGPPVMNLDSQRAVAPATVIQTFEDEVWVSVGSVVDAPVALASVVLLDRGDHPVMRVDRLPPSPALLLPHSLQSGRHPDRLARRFDLIADIAAAVPLLAASVPSACAPDAVAAALDDALDDVPWQPVAGRSLPSADAPGGGAQG